MKRAIATLALLLAACSGEQPAATTTVAEKPAAPPPPTLQQARELIAASPELGDFQFTNAGVSIPVAASSMSEPVLAMAKDLAAAQWLSFDDAGDIMLTDKARADKRFLLRTNGILDVVPLAKKEMGDVVTVHANPDGTAAADFTWRWIPNEVGSAFTSGPVHDRFAATNTSRATLIWDGSTWSVLKIE